MQIPQDVIDRLNAPSYRRASTLPKFRCTIFDPRWNSFVESWAPRIYRFVEQALGPYGTTVDGVIEEIDCGSYMAGANASFDLDSGKIKLSLPLEGNSGRTLEKMCHEMVHASLAKFPQNDPFYDEGFVDFTVFILGHADIWHPYDMLGAAAENIETRKKRAMLDQSDYDRKRWAGGLFASVSRGPWIVETLKMRKAEGNYQW